MGLRDGSSPDGDKAAGTTPFDALEHDFASWLAGRIDDPSAAAAARLAVHETLDTAGPSAVHAAIEDLRRAGPSDDGNPAQPLLRKVMRAWVEPIVTRSEVRGLEHLASIAGRPAVLLSNHLSYVDTTATDCVLVRAGAQAFADELTVLAGPKVWDTPFHTVATRALNIVPTVQSEAVGGTPVREAATRLLRGIALARARMAAGSPLLIYPEGTRSRTGQMGSFLRGVRHYLSTPGTVVVPVALWGTDLVYPIDAPRLSPGAVTLAIGPPCEISDPGAALADAWATIARMLPERHRPSADFPPVR